MSFIDFPTYHFLLFSKTNLRMSYFILMFLRIFKKRFFYLHHHLIIFILQFNCLHCFNIILLSLHFHNLKNRFHLNFLIFHLGYLTNCRTKAKSYFLKKGLVL